MLRRHTSVCPRAAMKSRDRICFKIPRERLAPPIDATCYSGCFAVEILAELETAKAPDLDLFTQLAGVFTQQLPNGAIGIAHPGLLFEHHVAIKFFEFALDNFCNHLLGFAG